MVHEQSKNYIIEKLQTKDVPIAHHVKYSKEHLKDIVDRAFASAMSDSPAKRKESIGNDHRVENTKYQFKQKDYVAANIVRESDDTTAESSSCGVCFMVLLTSCIMTVAMIAVIAAGHMN